MSNPNAGLATALGLVATLTLICLLITRELTEGQSSLKYKLVAKFSDVAIIPLTIVFGITIILKILEVLA